MPRSPRPWFRFYVEAIHDRKLRRRPPAQRWLWVVVLAVARAAPVAGYLLIGERSPVEEADLTDLAALPLRDVRNGLAYFQESGMLTFDELLGAWFVTAWESRQFESDDVTARTSKHRSNGRRRNVPTSAVGTPPETETETDNPLTPTADAVGEPVDNSSHTRPRRGMRGTGTSPRERAKTNAEVATHEALAASVAAFVAECGPDLDRDEVGYRALERWPHTPEMRTRAVSAWAAGQRKAAVSP